MLAGTRGSKRLLIKNQPDARVSATSASVHRVQGQIAEEVELLVEPSMVFQAELGRWGLLRRRIRFRRNEEIVGCNGARTGTGEESFSLLRRAPFEIKLQDISFPWSISHWLIELNCSCDRRRGLLHGKEFGECHQYSFNFEHFMMTFLLLCLFLNRRSWGTTSLKHPRSHPTPFRGLSAYSSGSTWRARLHIMQLLLQQQYQFNHWPVQQKFPTIW